jgi:hypothetical protein
MPVNGGYVERFTAWGVPDSWFLRWFERRGAAADEPRCNGQVPLGGPTKVFRACKRMPGLERKSEGGSHVRGMPLSAYISCHCIGTDPLVMSSLGCGGLCKSRHIEWMDVSKQEKRS